MKFSVSATKLSDLIIKAERLTSKKSALPILSNLFFEIADKFLIIRSTNLELGLEGRVAITEGEDIGNFIIDAAILKNFLHQVRSSKTISVEVDENKAKFSADAAEATIAVSEAEDFPTLPEISDDEVRTIDLSAKEFSEGVNSVWYAAASSTMKPELSSIYLHSHNNELYFVATDTFRLAEKRLSARNQEDSLSLLIPQQNALEITRIIDPEGELKMHFDSNLLVIEQKDIKITARVVDGNFPDYRQIIPNEFSTTATLLYYDLEQSLKLSSVFADKYYQLNIEFANDHITVASKGTDQGKSVTKIPASIEGDEIGSRFNQRYLMDPLNTLKGDNLVVQLSPNKPMLIKNPSDDSFRYLVMPMHQ